VLNSGVPRSRQQTRPDRRHPARVQIYPLHKIRPEVEVAEDLILTGGALGYDPLQAYMALFAERKADSGVVKQRPAAVEERLKERIVDGDRQASKPISTRRSPSTRRSTSSPSICSPA
jgi:hypothetical protein